MKRAKWKLNGPGASTAAGGVEYSAAPVPEGFEPGGFIAMAGDEVIGHADSLSEAQALCERAIVRKGRLKQQRRRSAPRAMQT
jgi:hypothetical protein